MYKIDNISYFIALPRDLNFIESLKSKASLLMLFPLPPAANRSNSFCRFKFIYRYSRRFLIIQAVLTRFGTKFHENTRIYNKIKLTNLINPLGVKMIARTRFEFFSSRETCLEK